MTYELSEAEFNVTDYLEETQCGYRVCHYLGVYGGIVADDLPLMQTLLISRIRAFNLAISSGHYKKAVEIVAPDRRIRLIVALAADGLIDLRKAWTLARQAWIYQSSIYVELAQWEMFFGTISDYRSEFMNEGEREHLNRLPDEVEIFRGYDPRYGRDGLSWTLSKVIASEYSTRHGNHIIARSKVKKANIVAYSNVKNEFEIIIPSIHAVENLRAINVLSQRKYRRWQGLGRKP